MPSIRWHWDDKSGHPIMATDFHPSGRLATAGQDGIVRTWHVRAGSNGHNHIDFLSEFRAHSSTINALRFSPNGMFLATAADDEFVNIYQLDGKSNGIDDSAAFGEDIGLYNVERWRHLITLKGHGCAVMDISWNPLSTGLMSAGMNGNVLIWSITAKSKHSPLAFVEQPLTCITSSSKDRCFVGLSSSQANILNSLKMASVAFSLEYPQLALLHNVPIITSTGLVLQGPCWPISNMTESASEFATSVYAQGTSNGSYVNGSIQPLPQVLPFAKLDEVAYSLKCMYCVEDHKHNVQGITWDPVGTFFMSISVDRTMRVYKLVNEKVQFVTESSKYNANNEALYSKETSATYFRRPDFTPDGTLLICPAGIDGANHCAHIYLRGNWSYPIASVQVPEQALAIRVCRTPFQIQAAKLQQPKNEPNLTPQSDSLPIYDTLNGSGIYYIFAVATSRSVYIFRTDTLACIGCASKIHVAPLTDLTWNSHTNELAISSQDGFMSFQKLDLWNDQFTVLSKFEKEAYTAYLHDMKWQNSNLLSITKQLGPMLSTEYHPLEDMFLLQTDEVTIEQNITQLEEELRAVDPTNTDEIEFVKHMIDTTTTAQQMFKIKKALFFITDRIAMVQAINRMVGTCQDIVAEVEKVEKKKPAVKKAKIADAPPTNSKATDAAIDEYIKQQLATTGKVPSKRNVSEALGIGYARAKKFVDSANVAVGNATEPDVVMADDPATAEALTPSRKRKLKQQ